VICSHTYDYDKVWFRMVKASFQTQPKNLTWRKRTCEPTRYRAGPIRLKHRSLRSIYERLFRGSRNGDFLDLLCTLPLGRRSFSGGDNHQTGNKFLRAVEIEIDGSSLGIRFGNDAKTILKVRDIRSFVESFQGASLGELALIQKKGGLAVSEPALVNYKQATLEACKPLGPVVTSNSTAWPSFSDLYPSA